MKARRKARNMGQAKAKLRAVASTPEISAPTSRSSEPQTINRADGTASPLSAIVMMVSPEMAKRWLERNHPNNRPITYKRAEAFANDIRADAWRLTHQAVAFDGEGLLIDGQHRLTAIVASGKPAEMLVIYNGAGSYHDPIDRVGPRSIATILGVKTNATAGVNVLRMFEIGYQLYTPMTVHEAEGLMERHAAALATIATLPGRSKLTGPIIGGVVWAMPCGKERALDFAIKVASGEMIGRGHPAYAYRNWRERNIAANTWENGLAVLNCLRHHLNDHDLSAVTVADSGYRAFCAKRRAMKIPNTPATDVVPPGESLKP